MYLPINLKGTRPHNMPRYSKKRGGGSEFRGISHHKVCILSAVDESDHMFFKVCGLGSETKEMTATCLSYFHIEEEYKYPLITDMKQVYKNVAECTNRTHEEVKSTSSTSNRGYSLASINQLHGELKSLLRTYKGVSTRHLQGYLDFFVLFKELKYKYETTQERVKQSLLQTIRENFSIKRECIFKKVFPVDLAIAYASYNYGSFSTSTNTCG